MNDHDRFAGSEVFFDPPAYLLAAEVGHVYIQEHEFGVQGAAQFERPPTAISLDDLILGGGQDLAANIAIGFIVVDVENRGHGSLNPRSFCLLLISPV